MSCTKESSSDLNRTITSGGDSSCSSKRSVLDLGDDGDHLSYGQDELLADPHGKRIKVEL